MWVWGENNSPFQITTSNQTHKFHYFLFTPQITPICLPNKLAP